MAVVFVSHASVDQELVDEFVDLVLRVGCELKPEEIFYSSGADTGVRDGEDLLGHVREQVSDTGLVVAMLTPTFQTRSVCVAELGAAWGHTGKLFPLLVPEMNRSELEGVLSTQLVEYMNNEGALDRLHDRITEITARRVDAATWTRAKQRWLARLTAIVEAGGVATANAVSAADHEALVAKCDQLTAALSAAEEDIDRLRAERDAIAVLKDRDDVAEVLLPSGDVERFEVLVDEARKALNKVGNRYVVDTLIATLSDNGALTTPSDPWDRDQLHEAAIEGLLVEGDGYYWASDAFPAHEEAKDAVKRAIEAVADDPDFEDWFEREYNAYPRMRNLKVLRRVFID